MSAEVPRIAGVEPYAEGAGWVLYCADSEALLAAGAIPGGCAIVTDPPYGIGYQHGGGAHSGWAVVEGFTRHGAASRIIGDDAPFDPRPWIDYAVRTSSPRGDKGSPAALRIALMGADHYAHLLPQGVGVTICWDKCAGGGPDDSFTDAEYGWIGSRTPRRIYRHLWKGRIRSKVGQDNAGDTKRRHVAEKPVGLMAWLMDRNRIPYHMPILDPYAGSGTTGVAALQQGRPCILIEIDPAHCAVAAERLRAAEESER